MSERTPEEWLLDYGRAVALREEGGSIGSAALSAWQSDRARIATLEARIAALVPLARWALAIGNGVTPEAMAKDAAARAALAAIAAEQTTTTGGQDDA
jgi:hypothetical protein